MADAFQIQHPSSNKMEEAKSQLPTTSATTDHTSQDSGETLDTSGESRPGSRVDFRSPHNSEGFKGDLLRVTKDLDELKVPGLQSPGSSGEYLESGSLSPFGPLRLFHRGTAVRMLTDYLLDLKDLNNSLDDSLRNRVKEYEAFLKELKEANDREPNSQLPWQERSKLSIMLRDYQSALSSFLEDQEEEYDYVAGVDDVEFKMKSDVADGVPLYLHEGEFSGGGYVESLTAALDRCETQVQEFMDDLTPVVLRRQCKYVVDALGPLALSNFKRYRLTLDALQKLEVDGVGFSSSSKRNCVHFCFESLVGLARKLQLVVDLFRKCSTGTEVLHRMALELADLPPPPLMSRWSVFSFAIRNCEWSMDLVELAFYTLEKLLSDGTHILQDVSFKWSEEKGRMVLQIGGKLGRQDSSRLEKPIVDVMKELEAKDVADLALQLQKLASETGNGPKWIFGGFKSKDDLNRASMANFLSNKLLGPIPHARVLPWTFRVKPTNLKFREYMDAGSAGMVARYTWFGENVAVKNVRSPGLSRHKFEEEAAILATVQHPNVVRLIGCGFIEKKKIGMLVMELMDNDLRTVIDSRVAELGPGSSPFSTIVAIDIIIQIAQAMRHLRDHKVLHRDLKAKNVLVNIYKPLNSGGASNTRLMQVPGVSTVLPHTQENYVAKLADFGLAKCRPNTSWVVTRMAGTTGWRAPEVFHVQDTEVTHEYRWPADVYSFAMTCYEILTGKLPFEDCTNRSIHEHVMAERRPQGLDELEIPDLLKELVKRCWATDPKERPSFEEIVKSLWECRVKAIVPVFERHITASSGVSRSTSTTSLKN